MSHEIKCPNCQKLFTIDEASYAEIQKQVHDAEFTKELESRLHEIGEMNTQKIELARKDMEAAYTKELSSKDQEINNLKSELKNASVVRDLAITNATSALQRKVDGYEKDLEAIKTQNENKELILRQNFETQLRFRDEEIERLKDMKAKLNNKLIGESLEQHCRAEYDKIRFAYPNATFEKDNDATKGETKGDFIFRNFDDDGTEIVSIMFDMKNQIDDAVSKQKKNSDHFKKLDFDRTRKKCEYAVLVSLLEPEDEYYNLGMVCANGYDKMYVVRPQFFIQIISLINNLALKSLGYKKQLATIREQNIDIENFEEKLQEWREKFNINQKRATKNFCDAIKDIDDIIKKLYATRESLRKTAENFGIAERKLENLNIRKLAKGNVTMEKIFADLDIKKLNDFDEKD